MTGTALPSAYRPPQLPGPADEPGLGGPARLLDGGEGEGAADLPWASGPPPPPPTPPTGPFTHGPVNGDLLEYLHEVSMNSKTLKGYR
jgi:hypothetical protein